MQRFLEGLAGGRAVSAPKRTRAPIHRRFQVDHKKAHRDSLFLRNLL